MATIIGTSGSDYLPGTTVADNIYGLAGNDIINGSGGNDTMVGGVGDDGYYVDSTYDVITEGVNAGTDSVYAYSSYTLGANVENLYMYGTGYYGYGNALNNYIAGNSGNNLIWGGAGNDTMAGGYGNDAYYVDSTYDVVTEGVGAGTDSVYAYSSYTLDANVENLYMYGTAYSGDGNALDNYIVGNSSDNDFWGFAGNDTINGGDGNDIFRGDEGNDSITGGAGNDTIRGSAGSDVLTGSAGADYFTFNSAGEGIDTINDFSRTQGDKIVLSSSGFGNLQTPGGSLAPSEFGTRILYNSSTGALSFDRDGTGTVYGSVQIATLSTRPILISSDFQVIA